MKKYYVHKDNEQLGPLSIDDLKELKITRQTMIWYEGADTWKKAEEISDLDTILKSVPPPLLTPPSLNNSYVEQTVLKSDKSSELLTNNESPNNRKSLK